MDTRTATADLPDELKSMLSPMELLTEAAAIAEARNDEDALEQISHEIVALLAEDDPEAVAVYEQHQAQQIGPDPLAKGGQDWPDALGVRRGPTIAVSPRSPLHGWRGWQVDGDRLLAPFNTVKGGLPADAPGITWKRGTNTNSTARCGHVQVAEERRLHSRGKRKRKPPPVHPRAGCRCGIRVVQSLTVLERFAEQTVDIMGDDLAFARVAFWGRVAPWAPDDDWAYTARAQYAAIVGDFTLPDHLEQLRPGLVARYGPALEA